MQKKLLTRIAVAAGLTVAFAVTAAAQATPAAQAGGVLKPRGQRPAGAGVIQAGTAKATSESTLRYSTREGARLRFAADIGTVRIRTIPGAQEVTVLMRVETDPRQPDAASLLRQVHIDGGSGAHGVHVVSTVPWSEFRGRLWVRFEVSTPRVYNLEVTTQAGNIILTEDVDGRVFLSSHGGNIEAGNISQSARLETEGGHVTVKNVGGDLHAITAGGHVTAGHIAGSAMLRTGGGHIRAASIQGVGNAETAGGDIAVNKTGVKFLAVSQSGGQITFGEAAGAIEARTAGGGIRVLNVSGPMQLNTAAGSIYLTQVRDAVSASTASGNITAWFSGEGKKKLPSKLQCSEGDIVVYLPRQLALNVEATIEGGTNQQVFWDPAIPLKLVSGPAVPAEGAKRGRVVRATGSINGGGETLRLRTVAGNIRLLYADEAQAEARRVHVQRVQQELKMQQLTREVHQHLVQELQAIEEQQKVRAQGVEQEQAKGRVAALRAMIEDLFTRTVRVDPSEQHQKLVFSTVPVYPTLAIRARVQGTVHLEAIISEDGRVAELRTIAGHPLLVQPARDAVATWQYKPTLVGNRPVRVITRIDVQFRLTN